MPSKQGIFIGLGGTGITTVAHIKAKILNDPDYNGNLQSMLRENHFIFLDTDEKTKTTINTDKELLRKHANQLPIPGIEFIDLGEANPYMTYQSAKSNKNDPPSDRLIEWAIDPDLPKHFSLTSKQVKHGVGSQRMAGRTAVWVKWENIISEIRSGLTKMVRRDNDQDDNNLRPSIWIFASSNGGTGSAAIMDVLYIADRVYREIFGESDPYLRLILYMPRPFIKVNDKNDVYSLNAFSVFWELNAFRLDAMNENDGRKFKYFSCRPDKANWIPIATKWGVYSYMIPIDTETNNNRFINLDDLFVNTSEMCYYLHRGAVGDTVVSKLDNDFLNEDYVNLPREDINTPFKWTKSLLAVGYKAVCKPDDLLKEYVRIRFMYDLFDYGLLGFDFNEINKNETAQNKAKKEFGDKYIFNYLTDTDGFEACDDSLQKKYNDLLEKVKVPQFEKDPTKEEWTTIFSTFKAQIKQKLDFINNGFNTTGDDLSKVNVLKAIEYKVKTGVEESIKEYGLLYTNHLIYLVDDKYCEIEAKKLYDKIPTESQLNNLLSSIQNLIDKGNRKKDLPTLQKLSEDYKKAELEKCLYRNVINILYELTKEKTGYLEILRNGNNTIQGLDKIKTQIDILKAEYAKYYQSLAKNFKATKEEVFTTFIPSVSTFPGDPQTWADNHLFEQLYSNIVTLDSTSVAKRKGNKDLGFPPVRDDGKGKGLKIVITDILNQLLEQFFSNLSLEVSISSEYKLSDFITKAEEYINNKIKDTNGDVYKWLNKTLDQVFSDTYKSTSDAVLFSDNFSNNIPVLYPMRSGVVHNGQTRYLYAGDNQDFAKKLGFKPDNNEYQFMSENNLLNRFYVFKMEVGHNLYDYAGFDEIENVYKTKQPKIANNGFGCHIHKDFAKLDLAEIISLKVRSPLIDFFKLSYLDEFFKLLFIKDKTLYENIFEKISGTTSSSRLLTKTIAPPSVNHKNIISVSKTGNILTLSIYKFENVNLIKYLSQEQKILSDIDSLTTIEAKMIENQCNYSSQLKQIESKFRSLPVNAQVTIKDLLIKLNDDIIDNLATSNQDIFAFYNEYSDNDTVLLPKIENNLTEMNQFFK